MYLEEAAEVVSVSFHQQRVVEWIPVVQQRTDATGAVLNRIPDVPVLTQRRIPVQRVQKNIEFPHVQHSDKMVHVPDVQVHRSTLWKRRLRSQSRRSRSDALRSLESRLLRAGRAHMSD